MFEVELTNYMNIHKLCMRFVHKKRFNCGMCSRFYNAIHMYKAVVHVQHVRKLYTGTLSAVRTDGMMSCPTGSHQFWSPARLQDRPRSIPYSYGLHHGKSNLSWTCWSNAGR